MWWPKYRRFSSTVRAPAVDSLPRRSVLTKGTKLFVSGTTLVAATNMSACGFRLRGSIGLPFSSIYVEAPNNSPIANELKGLLRNLQSSTGGSKLADSAKDAQVVVKVISETREREVLGFSTTGAQRDYQVRVRFRYETLTTQRDRIGEPIELLLRRDVTTIDSQITARQEEDQLLYREMQSDIVLQVMSRLAALKL
jgi:LPS-assembly lipoprotein